MRVLVIIPAYNERESLPAVLDSLTAYSVLVIDDGSTDGTQGDITFGRNRGKGEALKAGLNIALVEGYDHAVLMDADGQHPAEEIPRLLATKGDLVIGSRFLLPGGDKSTPLRRAAMVPLRWLTGVSDPTSGFRALNREAMKVCQSDVSWPEFHATMAAKRAGLQIIEVPVLMKPRTAGVSKLTVLM